MGPFPLFAEHLAVVCRHDHGCVLQQIPVVGQGLQFLGQDVVTLVYAVADPRIQPTFFHQPLVGRLEFLQAQQVGHRDAGPADSFRGLGVALTVLLALQAALGLVVARTWLSARNTLFNNGNSHMDAYHDLPMCSDCTRSTRFEGRESASTGPRISAAPK